MGSDFKLMFRMSRSRFQRLMEDVMARDIKFYKVESTLLKGSVASLEARLLLPLKALAYGVPAYAFRDYFQVSKTFARECCYEFDNVIRMIYQNEFLRLPTAFDLQNITKLHKAKHKVDGMIGSLDCTHTYWKNCPTAWQGSYTGRPDVPSIVLEAVADYNLFFWHVSYGYPGTYNDLNILNLSPLFESMIDGSLEALEREAGCVPFKIGDEEFNKCFFLVDGIYGNYSRFVKPIKAAIEEKDKRYTGWQEASRKDVERAFAVLKKRYQFLDRPIHQHKVQEIANRVTCCLILHNISVTDRVMGDVGVTYNPIHNLDAELLEAVDFPSDLIQVQENFQTRSTTRRYDGSSISGIGTQTLNAIAQETVSQRDRFKDLTDENQCVRLHLALKEVFGVSAASRSNSNQEETVQNVS
jgi:hypothetical protein